MRIMDDESRKALKLARASKLKGMRELGNSIYSFVYEVFKRNKLPVDKFGHFYCKGGETVEDRVSPDFSDLDFLLAKIVENGEKIDKLLSRGGKVKI